jgi:DNA primase
MPDLKEIIEVNGREVVISNTGKLFFPGHGITKLDIVRYYLSVADGALGGIAGRPMVLKRYVHGADGEASGSRGFHIYAPILPRWTFTQVRACAATRRRITDIMILGLGHLPPLATA